jgi:hypothetical protein
MAAASIRSNTQFYRDQTQTAQQRSIVTKPRESRRAPLKSGDTAGTSHHDDDRLSGDEIFAHE